MCSFSFFETPITVHKMRSLFQSQDVKVSVWCPSCRLASLFTSRHHGLKNYIVLILSGLHKLQIVTQPVYVLSLSPKLQNRALNVNVLSLQQNIFRHRASVLWYLSTWDQPSILQSPSTLPYEVEITKDNIRETCVLFLPQSLPKECKECKDASLGPRSRKGLRMSSLLASLYKLNLQYFKSLSGRWLQSPNSTWGVLSLYQKNSLDLSIFCFLASLFK